VSVLGENTLGLVILFWGVQRYGATVNPINVEVQAGNVAQILHDVAPALILHQRGLPAALVAAARGAGAEALAFADAPDDAPAGDLWARLARYPATPGARPPGDPRDIALIDYTSGSAAAPKGVCLSHEAFFYGCDSVVRRFAIGRDDRVLEYRSVAWASPQLLSVGSTLHAGGTLVLARKFSHQRFFAWLAERRVTIAAGLPTVLSMLLERPVDRTAADVPALRYMTSSAAPLDPERQREFERRYGIPIVQGCGMTEAGFMAGNDPAAPRRGSIGRAMDHVEARFVDAAGAPCPPGVEGELVVGGRQMASAYLAGRDVLVPIPSRDFRTGDLGWMDADGYIYLSGRKKELIIKGGVNIAPAEVTATLLAHPAVADAATLGVPDPVYGETVVAFVVARAGASAAAEDLLAHCRARLSPFKAPSAILAVDAIPRTERGKAAREALLTLWRRHQPAGDAR
jgi:acyl-coenzyme A synthetase/AMP-(fatty) acid ligase